MQFSFESMHILVNRQCNWECTGVFTVLQCLSCQIHRQICYHDQKDYLCTSILVLTA